jgi:adenylate kinase
VRYRREPDSAVKAAPGKPFMLKQAIPVMGPPASGKTTLTMQLGTWPGWKVFRLREHVPQTILAATASSAERLGWIDDVTVALALRSYIEATVAEDSAHSVLLDNFPGSAAQVSMLLSVIAKLAPGCQVHPVELVADPMTLTRRVRARRVCHRCEPDPIRDPRQPAASSAHDPRRCARCFSTLQPRRGDAPRLLQARAQRYEQAAISVRRTFRDLGLAVVQLPSSRPPDQLASAFITQLALRSTAS